MSISDGIDGALGKTVVGVAVAKRREGRPGNQVFLVFDDETHFAIWGEDVNPASGVDIGGMKRVLDYIERMGGHVEQQYLKPLIE